MAFSKKFPAFFKQLERNNDRTWFNAHKEEYIEFVKEPFEAFIEELISHMRKVDPSIKITPKDAIFRIYRDVRFSKFKIPYKTHASAIVTRGGRKNLHGTPGLYVQIDHTGIKAYSGLHHLETKELHKTQRYIADNLAALKKIISVPAFKKTYGVVMGDRYKRIPKEYEEVAKKQPLIANRQFYVMAELPISALYKNDLPTKLVKIFKVTQPLNKFLVKAAGLK